jgi:3-phytase
VTSQGSDSFIVYRLPAVAYVEKFKVADVSDDVRETDGIDLKVGDFGPQYPGGLFVAQEGENPDGIQNFKMVGWRAIAEKLKLDLSLER